MASSNSLLGDKNEYFGNRNFYGTGIAQIPGK
jgi:hypothetical protein